MIALTQGYLSFASKYLHLEQYEFSEIVSYLKCLFPILFCCHLHPLPRFLRIPRAPPGLGLNYSLGITR